jgi:hypothetical protein
VKRSYVRFLAAPGGAADDVTTRCVHWRFEKTGLKTGIWPQFTIHPSVVTDHLTCTNRYLNGFIEPLVNRPSDHDFDPRAVKSLHCSHLHRAGIGSSFIYIKILNGAQKAWLNLIFLEVHRLEHYRLLYLWFSHHLALSSDWAILCSPCNRVADLIQRKNLDSIGGKITTYSLWSESNRYLIREAQLPAVIIYLI